MGLVTRAREVINNIFRKNNKPSRSSLTSWFPSFTSGVSKDTALQNHAAIYGAINRKSNAIGQMPIKLHRKKDGKRIQVDDYRAELVGARPEINRSAFIFWRTIEAMKEIYGNAYAFIERDIDGEIIQLKLLDPKSVKPFENEDDNNELYYKVSTKKGIIAIHHMDILHFPSIYSSGYEGISFIEALSNQLNLNKTTQETAKSQAENSLKVSGVIKLATNLKKEARELYKNELKEMYSKGWNSVLVLENGVDYQQIRFDVQDLKLLENNKITIQQVSMTSGVPLFMLSEMDGAKYGSIEHQNIHFVQSCISPDAIMIEQELNYKLLSPKERKDGMYFKFNINALVRGDMKTRADYYNKMTPIAGMTPNKIYELEDMEDIGPLGDRPLVSLNYTFLDTLENHERIKKQSKGGEGNGEGKQTGNGTEDISNKKPSS
ncbi:phage-like protein [Gottschalkia purinilytica]|uniref:Phage-like protein n=1 Tax=Gottschalkia purinilytica TaxID=1503 RepID=A0A0L0W674_GOTPU|nr:phage portal protein [Gottschalkia purinilytica]KNF06972.1 phage-like protein [Gottschalkia purinilytica]